MLGQTIQSQIRQVPTFWSCGFRKPVYAYILAPSWKGTRFLSSPWQSDSESIYLGSKRAKSSADKTYPFSSFQNKASSRILYAGWDSATPSCSSAHLCFAGLDSVLLEGVTMTVTMCSCGRLSCKRECRVKKLVGS